MQQHVRTLKVLCQVNLSQTGNDNTTLFHSHLESKHKTKEQIVQKHTYRNGDRLLETREGGGSGLKMGEVSQFYGDG